MSKLLLTSLSKYQNFGLLISRIIIGSSYIYVHGSKKILGGPEMWSNVGAATKAVGINIFPMFWGFMAGFAEFFGGIFIVLGLLFRPAAFLIITTMFMAAANHISHGDPISKIAYPIEMSALLILLIFSGAGKYSLDKILFNKI